MIQRIRKKQRRNNSAVIMVFIALLVPILLGYGSFILDVSRGFTESARVKDAVDLAALAGVSQLESLTSLTTAKNTALSNFNSNLSETLPGFMPVMLGGTGLIVEGGVFDLAARTFTVDESATNINAIRVTYTRVSSTNLATVFMIDSIPLTSKATAAKQYAGGMPPGTGFPLIVKAPNFCMDVSGNMITLINGMSENSWWTGFDQMGGTAEALDIIWWWQTNMTTGTSPGGLTVGDNFKKHLGNDNNVWMNIDPDGLTGMNYVFPVGTDIGGNMIRVDGFIGASLDSIDPVAESLVITIIPGYINNLYGGFKVASGANTGALCMGGEDFLSYGYTLVE